MEKGLISSFSLTSLSFSHCSLITIFIFLSFFGLPAFHLMKNRHSFIVRLPKIDGLISCFCYD